MSVSSRGLLKATRSLAQARGLCFLVSHDVTAPPHPALDGAVFCAVTGGSISRALSFKKNLPFLKLLLMGILSQQRGREVTWGRGGPKTLIMMTVLDRFLAGLTPHAPSLCHSVSHEVTGMLHRLPYPGKPRLSYTLSVEITTARGTRGQGVVVFWRTEAHSTPNVGVCIALNTRPRFAPSSRTHCLWLSDVHCVQLLCAMECLLFHGSSAEGPREWLAWWVPVMHKDRGPHTVATWLPRHHLE